MSQVYSSRFAGLFKNLFGIRGPHQYDVPDVISPGLDLGRKLPEIDDQTLFWSLTVSQAAVAAQFGFAAFNVPSGRAIIDDIYFRTNALAVSHRFGYTAPFGGVNAVVIRNLYGGSVPPLNHFNSSVRAAIATQVADPLAGATSVDFMDLPANAPNPPARVPLGLLLFPGQDLTIATGLVNQVLGVILRGRAWPTYPE